MVGRNNNDNHRSLAMIKYICSFLDIKGTLENEIIASEVSVMPINCLTKSCLKKQTNSNI